MPPAYYPCDIAERADTQRQQIESHCHWLVQDEPDGYDQQLRDEEEAGLRAAMAWVDSLSDADLQALQQPAPSPDRDLLTELRAQPPGNAHPAP